MKSLCSPVTPIALPFTAVPAPAFAPRPFAATRKESWSSRSGTGDNSAAFAAGAEANPSRADPAGAVPPTAITVQDPLPLWKRGVDLAGCLAALPFLALCTVFMALLTRFVSPGPVFYWQERIGHRGQRFRLYKFRTMEVGADRSVHHAHTRNLIGTNAPMVKLDHRGDARLIPAAWLLRASGLDELPQLINVLRGEMSLVGPRPCLPAEFEHFAPGQGQRCEGLPGLTGLWQVSGKNRTTFQRMIELDLQYVRTFSFWLDLKIIVLTVPSLLVQIQETCRARKSKPRHDPEVVTVAPFTQSTDRPTP